MDLQTLKYYSNWIDRSPDEVLRSVKYVGGWQFVFPTMLPPWANKVRNYFNETPKRLKRLDKSTAGVHLKYVEKVVASLQLTRIASAFPVLKDAVHKAYKQKYQSKLPKPNPNTPDPGLFDDLGESFALSGDVYEDYYSGHIWYQMSPGGTIYHWGKDPGKHTAALEAFLQSPTRGQRFIPVFKLVSPDGTGGSRECCIKNPQSQTLKVAGLPEVRAGRAYIGEKVNEWVNVEDLIEKDPHYQGSYNYSETVEKELAAHEMRDVVPHKKMGGNYKLYVDPLDRVSQLVSRRFPRLDTEQKPLATQV